MKMFPIMIRNYGEYQDIDQVRRAYGTSVIVALPFPMLEAHEKQAFRNHNQTIARLAERGGLTACEALAVLEDRAWRKEPIAAAHAKLKELFCAWVNTSSHS